jgi:uncharacterized protein YuzE
MIILTKHAQESVRKIEPAWIEAATGAPDFVEADPRHPERARSYKAIAESGGRVLGCASTGRRRYRRHHGAFRSRSAAMIRTSYDPEADAMFVWFGPEGVKSAGTEEVSPGIMLDFDGEGRVIGIEVLDVSERMTRPKAAA